MSAETPLSVFLNQIARSHESRLGSLVARGRASKRALRTLAREMYLQEKWPSHIAQVYLSLDHRGLRDKEVIRYILSILRAENLGAGSKGAPHLQLAERFAASVGVSSDQLKRAEPTPANQALMDWCDMSLQGRSWLEALAVHVACESQFTTMRRIRKGLLTHYGLIADDVELWTIHAGRIERRHARDGLDILEAHAKKADRKRLIYTFEFTCKLVCAFYDSILEDHQ